MQIHVFQRYSTCKSIICIWDHPIYSSYQRKNQTYYILTLKYIKQNYIIRSIYYQKGQKKPQGTSFIKKFTIIIRIIEQKTRFKAKVENILGKRIQLCFLQAYHPYFFSYESLSLRQILVAKRIDASPQNTRNPTIFPEHRTKELQMNIQPKQLGFRVYLKNPVEIRPKCILRVTFFLFQGLGLLIVRSHHQDNPRKVQNDQKDDPLDRRFLDAMSCSQRDRDGPICKQKQKQDDCRADGCILLEGRIGKGDVFEDPEPAIGTMQEEIEIHTSAIIVEYVHEQDHPEESGPFEYVYDVVDRDSLCLGSWIIQEVLIEKQITSRKAASLLAKSLQDFM